MPLSAEIKAALDAAIANKFVPDFEKIVRGLDVASLNELDPTEMNHSWLMKCAIRSFPHGIPVLLAKGVDSNLEDALGLKALMYLANAPHAKIFEELAAVTTNVNVQVARVNNSNVLHVLVEGNERGSTLYTDEFPTLGISSEDTIYFGHNMVANVPNGVIGSIDLGPRADGYTVDQQRTMHIINQVAAALQQTNSEELLAKLKALPEFDIDATNAAGHSCMYILATTNYQGYKNLLQWFVDNKADVDKASNEGVTPLYASLGFHGQPIDPELVTWLVKIAHADPNIPMNDGDTPMHMAHHHTRVDIAKLFKQHNASFNTPNDHKQPPLYYLLANKATKVEAKETFFKEFVGEYNLDLRDDQGQGIEDWLKEFCPSLLPLINDPTLLATWLVDTAQDDPNAPMEDGDTPVHMVHHYARADLAKIFKTHHIDFNANNKQQQPPLYYLLANQAVTAADKEAFFNEFADMYDFRLRDNQNHNAVDWAHEFCPSLEVTIQIKCLGDMSINDTIHVHHAGLEEAGQSKLINGSY